MHSHSNAPALALRAIGMHPKYAGYGYSLAILRITHRHPEYIYRLPKAKQSDYHIRFSMQF